MRTTKLEIREWELVARYSTYRVEVLFADPLSGCSQKYMAEYVQLAWHPPELVEEERTNTMRNAVLTALRLATTTPEVPSE